MPKTHPQLFSFNGGEASELIDFRSDISKYPTLCKILENAFPLVEGGAKKMPGTYYAGSTKFGGASKVRFESFEFSTNQTAVIEFGVNYIRIWENGGLLLTTYVAWVTGTSYALGALVTEGVNYYQCIVTNTSGTFANDLAAGKWVATSGPSPLEVLTPYLEADLFDLDIGTQSADVLYIIHSSYPPAQLMRNSATSWSLQNLVARGTEDVIKTGYQDIGIPISAITAANPCVVTAPNNGFANGQRIYINEITGMVQLNEGEFLVANISGNTFNLAEINTVTGAVITTTQGDVTGLTETNIAVGFSAGFTYSASGGTGTGLTITVDAIQEHGWFAGWIIAWHIANPGSGYSIGDIVSFFGSAGAQQYQVTGITASSNSSGGGTPLLVNSSGYIAYEGGGFAVAVNPMFNTADNYPACGAFYEQRLCLAGTINEPTTMNGSVQDDFPDFICDPNEDDYAVQFKLVSQKVDQILNMIASPNALLLGTAGGVWAMAGSNGGALTQNNVLAQKQTTIGVGRLQPQLVNDSAIFVSRSARIVVFLVYNFVTNQWDNFDLTRLNRNITIGASAATSGIVQTAFQSEPYPVFWAVRADGQLIGLVFNKQDQVFAWFRVVTDGLIESIAVVSEDNAEDQLWIIVNRTINGVSQRYVEYFMPQELFGQLSNAFFVHCGQTYNGAATSTITGLGYLEGKKVQVVTDGARHPDCTVVGGSITLQWPASIVTVGLPYKMTVQPMNPVINSQGGTSRGMKQKINRATLSVYQGIGGKMGTDLNHMHPISYGSGSKGLQPAMFTGEITRDMTDDFKDQSTFYITNEEPFPFTLRGLVLRMSFNED